MGANADFFALGGHSLLAVRLLARTTETFRVQIPLRTFFEAPTPAGLTRAVARARIEGTSTPPPLTRHESAEPTPLSFTQQRLWVLDRLQPGNAAYNLASALRLKGELDANALRRAVAELERRHEAPAHPARRGERRAHTKRSWRRVKRSSCGMTPPPPPIHCRMRRDNWGAIAATPFDLAEDPLFRAHLFRLDARDHLLGFILHHVVTGRLVYGPPGPGTRRPLRGVP